MFSPAEPEARIFSRGAVLGKLDALVEVGVGETVMATPSASHAGKASDALERGVAFSLSKNPRREAASDSAGRGCVEHTQTEGAVSP
jgi:hypothetical protein